MYYFRINSIYYSRHKHLWIFNQKEGTFWIRLLTDLGHILRQEQKRAKTFATFLFFLSAQVANILDLMVHVISISYYAQLLQFIDFLHNAVIWFAFALLFTRSRQFGFRTPKRVASPSVPASIRWSTNWRRQNVFEDRGRFRSLTFWILSFGYAEKMYIIDWVGWTSIWGMPTFHKETIFHGKRLSPNTEYALVRTYLCSWLTAVGGEC